MQNEAKRAMCCSNYMTIAKDPNPATGTTRLLQLSRR
jgi:hypothetical protein